MFDAHLHVVDPDTAGVDRTGNPAGGWWREVDATPGAVATRLRDAGVDGGVLVQAVGAHGFDNRLVIQAARALGPQYAAMVALDPASPDVMAELATAAARGATGLRLFSVPTPDEPWLDTEAGIALVERSGRLGMVPTVCCLPGELGAAGRLAAAVPEVEIALDHAGFVAVGGDDGALVALADHDNLVMKLSAGVFDLAQGDPPACVARLVDLFGADRIAWGSDHPQVHDRPYSELVAQGRAAVVGLADSSRAAILGGTARRLWLR